MRPISVGAHEKFSRQFSPRTMGMYIDNNNAFSCKYPTPAGPVAGVPCGTIDGVVVEGIVDEDGMLCCPEGCGTCGGTTCSTMPMSWVKPHPNGEPLAVDPSVPEDATSGGEQSKPVRMSSKTASDVSSEFIRKVDDLQRCQGGGLVVPVTWPQVLLLVDDFQLPFRPQSKRASLPLLPFLFPFQNNARQQTDFCCMRIMETLEAVCGVDGVKAPCRMPQSEHRNVWCFPPYIQVITYLSAPWLLFV